MSAARKPAKAAPRAKPKPNAAQAASHLTITYRPLIDLKPYIRNARRHSPAQIAKIKASLLEFGWANAMLVAESQMIAGHARLVAALELLAEGQPIPHTLDSALGPTIDLSHLTIAQRRAYVLADNRLAEEAVWDLELLRGEFEGLSGASFDATLAGFSMGEISTTLNGWTPDFARHDKEPAALDPLLTMLKVRCASAQADAVIVAVRAAVIDMPGVTIDR